MNIGDIYAGLVLVTPPASEPITLQEALDFLRLGDGDSGGPIDRDVQRLITAARQFCEIGLRRAIGLQTWRLSLKNWPGRDYQNWPMSLTGELDYYYKYNFIKLPLPPLQSVDELKFMDSSGTTKYMTAAEYQVLPGYTYNVFPDMEPGRIVLPYAQIWPTDILMPGAPIQITYKAGYKLLAEQSSPPEGQTFEYWEGYRVTMQAMKMLITEWFERRLPAIETLRSRADYLSGPAMVAQTLLAQYAIYD